MSRFGTDLADRLRAKGLHVIEVPGWQTRGRPGTFIPRVVGLHHTAGSQRSLAPSLAICTHGRAGIPGPLCQILIARFDPRINTCAVYVIATGKANVNGYGGWRGTTGNAYSCGVEMENDGRSEPWHPEMLRVGHTAAVVLGDMKGIPTANFCEHKEWAPTRKVDRARIDGGWARTQIAAIRAGTHEMEDEDVKFAKGAKGTPILRLQMILGGFLNLGEWWPGRSEGARPANTILMDGVFGPETEKYIKQVQGRLGYPQTGVWTWVEDGQARAQAQRAMFEKMVAALVSVDTFASHEAANRRNFQTLNEEVRRVAEGQTGSVVVPDVDVDLVVEEASRRIMARLES